MTGLAVLPPRLLRLSDLPDVPVWPGLCLLRCRWISDTDIGSDCQHITVPQPGYPGPGSPQHTSSCVFFSSCYQHKRTFNCHLTKFFITFCAIGNINDNFNRLTDLLGGAPRPASLCALPMWRCRSDLPSVSKSHSQQKHSHIHST